MHTLRNNAGRPAPDARNRLHPTLLSRTIDANSLSPRGDFLRSDYTKPADASQKTNAQSAFNDRVRSSTSPGTPGHGRPETIN